MTVCPAIVHWTVCAEQVKTAIGNAQSAQEAVVAADRWADRYKQLYEMNPTGEWLPSDIDLFEKKLEDLLDDTVGQWLDPADLALGMALSRYLPKVATVLEFASGAIASAIFVLLAPSPVANEFQAAKPVNDEIANLLRAKLEGRLGPTWQWSYDAAIRDAFQQTQGGKNLP